MVRHNSTDAPTRRANLTAFLSENDGRTWVGELELDERYGVSYPDGFQSMDGAIHIAYDHLREDGEFLMATFREEDVLAGKAVSGKCRFRQVIYRLPGYAECRNKRQIHIKLMANQ